MSDPCRVCGETYPVLDNPKAEMFMTCCAGEGVTRVRRVLEQLTPPGFPSGIWRTQAIHYQCDGCGEQVYTPSDPFAEVQRKRMERIAELLRTLDRKPRPPMRYGRTP